MLSTALEEELNVLDFVQWLKYYYFLLFDCFPFFLPFLTSLIRFILWLKFFYRGNAGRGHGVRGSALGRPHRVLLVYNMVF